MGHSATGLGGKDGQELERVRVGGLARGGGRQFWGRKSQREFAVRGGGSCAGWYVMRFLSSF